eukprot:2536602-Amphidinium_carterae.1
MQNKHEAHQHSCERPKAIQARQDTRIEDELPQIVVGNQRLVRQRQAWHNHSDQSVVHLEALQAPVIGDVEFSASHASMFLLS